MAAALALAAVGVTQNGWYARSLGATETAGTLFLILGTASDVVALVVPSVASTAWQARHWATAFAGWMVWLATLVFATMAGIGFASTNISDVTMVRASRETSAVKSAAAALDDAMASRDRECKGGVGRYCREREQAVVDRRQALDAAMQTVAQAADPQAVAAVKLVSWLTAGAISPNENDFGMLRLALLCLLPQLAGVLLMVGRGSNDGGTQGTMTSTPWTIIKSRHTVCRATALMRLERMRLTPPPKDYGRLSGATRNGRWR